MKFIRLNFLDERTITFSLDVVGTYESDGDGTKIVLHNGLEIIFPIPEDAFTAKVFSDEADDREYQLIEFDEPEPPTWDGIQFVTSVI